MPADDLEAGEPFSPAVVVIGPGTVRFGWEEYFPDRSRESRIGA
jgi:hypothetical protein